MPKAGPVQQLTVQGLQPVHVAQEVCVSPTCLWANWGSVPEVGGGERGRGDEGKAECSETEKERRQT